MRFSSALGALALAANAVHGARFSKEDYDSGRVMKKIMETKTAHWAKEKAAGAMDSSQWAELGPAKCVNGIADAKPGVAGHQFKCKNIDLYSFVSHADLGCNVGGLGEEGSGSWGWTAPDGREYIAHGCFGGTPLLEITKEGKIVKRGFLTQTVTPAQYSFWKEVRSYKNYMLIGSEREGHGVQIFDMTKLLNITGDDEPVIFDGKVGGDVESHFFDLMPDGSMHNVHVHEELNYGIAMGNWFRNEACRGGLIFFNLTDPTSPNTLGCAGMDGYVHDVQCLVYHGPDTKYEGHDICYGYNEDSLTIYDVTDKTNPVMVSRTAYVGVTYTHQGTVLDPNWQEFLVLDDEYDEEENLESDNPALDLYPVTYIFDIRSLEKPVNTGLYKGTTRSVDHNQYIINGINYQSDYTAGLRIYDVSSIPENPRGDDVCEIAFFDIFPEDDNLPGGGSIAFSGTWSHYAYFKSGYIYVNTIERGGFVVKVNRFDKCKPHTCNADLCLRGLRANTIPGRLEQSQKFCGEFTKTFVADVAVLPAYVKESCTGNVISRASSACSCLPTASVSP